MIVEDVLHSIFNKEFDEPERNPNDPVDQPFFAVKSKILTQALHRWLEEAGGEIALDDIRKTIRGNIITMIGTDVKGFNDILSFVSMKQKIKTDLEWYIRIVDSFNVWEEARKASQNITD
jgi:hypothetical protein